MRIHGIVARGFGIASGQNKKGVPGPGGVMLKDSFVRQRVFFEAKVPELKEVWTGTINVNISPYECVPRATDHEITCQWHPGITETFWIIKGVSLVADGKTHQGFIYYPMPSDIHTPRHSIIEVLAPKINGLTYGDRVELILPHGKLTVRKV